NGHGARDQPVDRRGPPGPLVGLAEQRPWRHVPVRDSRPGSAGSLIHRRARPAFRTRDLQLAGRLKRKIAPRGELCIAHSFPPWASTIEREIASPMPSPWDFVV